MHTDVGVYRVKRRLSRNLVETNYKISVYYVEWRVINLLVRGGV